MRNGRTVRKWEAGENDVPGPAWVALRYLLAAAGHGRLVRDVDKLLASDDDRRRRSTEHLPASVGPIFPGGDAGASLKRERLKG